MSIIVEILSNRVIQAAALSWAIAQGLKVFLTLLISRKFDSSRMWGSGGMPSSHSSMVCAMMMVVGFREGFTSSMFALAACFAGVVMYDAAGVRRSAGKNAAVINHLLDGLAGNGFVFDEERLKELVGHTPIQVLAGALLGILVGTLAA
ncbi:MAG: divergent PAP2 family protein [Clostridia bacterium]|nr:divergent PAP2 family protein [Clostridia bacterium]